MKKCTWQFVLPPEHGAAVILLTMFHMSVQHAHAGLQ